MHGAGTSYWVPLDVVIEFKRDVYQRALQELSRFLHRPGQGAHRQPARYLRQQHDAAMQPRETRMNWPSCGRRANRRR